MLQLQLQSLVCLSRLREEEGRKKKKIGKKRKTKKQKIIVITGIATFPFLSLLTFVERRRRREKQKAITAGFTLLAISLLAERADFVLPGESRQRERRKEVKAKYIHIFLPKLLLLLHHTKVSQFLNRGGRQKQQQRDRLAKVEKEKAFFHQLDIKLCFCLPCFVFVNEERKNKLLSKG